MNKSIGGRITGGVITLVSALLIPLVITLAAVTMLLLVFYLFDSGMETAAERAYVSARAQALTPEFRRDDPLVRDLDRLLKGPLIHLSQKIFAVTDSEESAPLLLLDTEVR